MRPPSTREVPIHGLRPNEIVWTPPCVIFLDTETDTTVVGGNEVLGLRLWVACRVDRRTAKGPADAVWWGWGDTADELGDWLESATRGRSTVWMFAHNLAFDLVTTRLPMLMADRGWEVTDFSVRSAAPFLRLRRRSKGLTVVDSWSWLPEGLSDVGHRVGVSKVKLPVDWEDTGQWFARCATDVDIMGRAVLELMAWWDRNELGRWTITGPGCGWNAMRHRPSRVRHTIDPDPVKVAEDRLAVRGGRKDAQYYGPIAGGPFVELDLVAAYPTVAATKLLPVKRLWSFSDGRFRDEWLSWSNVGVVAEVELGTDRPRYPVRWSGVTWYPVGRFRTVLAGPELEWAWRSGHVRHVGAGQVHRLGSALQPWAAWVLGVASGENDDSPPVARLAAKSWGRSVIGKFAARSHTAEQLGSAVHPGWSICDGWDVGADRPGSVVEMAGKRWNVTYNTDSENCYPAVLGFVESHTRRRLGSCLEALGAAWVSCDTDGVIVDTRWLDPAGNIRPHQAPTAPPDPLGAAGRLCDRLLPLVSPLVLRPKRLYESLDVLGPQHLVMSEERRMAGIRSDATVIGRRSFKQRDWPKLAWQIKQGSSAGYVRPERKVTFDGPLIHRWVTQDGRALPVRFNLAPDGANHMMALTDRYEHGQLVKMAGQQYRKLAGLY